MYEYMQIGGFIPQSLIDYPGKVAAVVFTQGCNFRCGYCHNPALVLPELFTQNKQITILEILAYLRKRSRWLDAIVVTGGEPTIHVNLPDFLYELKAMGYAVKLDTNGSNPEMLTYIINHKLADYVAMDIKTILNVLEYSRIIGIPDSLAILERIKQSIAILRQNLIAYEFRTTKIPNVHTPDIMEKITSLIRNNEQFTINDFRAGNLINSQFS